MRWRRVFLGGRCTDCGERKEDHADGGITCPPPTPRDDTDEHTAAAT